MPYRSLLIATAVSLGGVAVLAQAPEPLRFEVVSIKRNLSVTTDGGMQDLLGGAFEMRNEPITSILSSGSPVRVRGVEGIPDWAKTERYDIIAKPASAITGRQQNEMMRNLLIDRFKLSGHVEQRERDVFNLVLARQDGRLGIGMARSTLDCANSLASGADDPRKTCGASVGSPFHASTACRRFRARRLARIPGRAAGTAWVEAGADEGDGARLRHRPSRAPDARLIHLSGVRARGSSSALRR